MSKKKDKGDKIESKDKIEIPKGQEVVPCAPEELEVAAPGVRRLPVPGGWIYQVECEAGGRGWHPPVYVPNNSAFTESS